MAERPILFSAPMVRALLAGTKTQTRRLVEPKPYPSQPAGIMALAHCTGDFVWPDPKISQVSTISNKPGGPDGWAREHSPYGQPGDRLWVREPFARIDGQTQPWIETDYRATYTHGDRLGDSLGIKKRWTPSIHMPRAASRITLEITAVRVERLQAISEADARSEGSPCIDEVSGREVLFPEASKCGTYKLGYRYVWEQINGAGSWDANPWAWVITFRRLEQQPGTGRGKHAA